jgi:hypothetical protein
MADQASISRGNGVRFGSAPVAGMVGSIADLGGDIANLAELQAKLAALDLKECTGKAMIPVGALAGGLALCLASLPVALIGASELLATAMHLTERGWAYLIVAAIALVVALAVAAVAALRLRKSLDSFQRSREELARNIAWIRTVLLYSGRGTSRS